MLTQLEQEFNIHKSKTNFSESCVSDFIVILEEVLDHMRGNRSPMYVDEYCCYDEEYRTKGGYDFDGYGQNPIYIEGDTISIPSIDEYYFNTFCYKPYIKFVEEQIAKVEKMLEYCEEHIEEIITKNDILRSKEWEQMSLFFPDSVDEAIFNTMMDELGDPQ